MDKLHFIEEKEGDTMKNSAVSISHLKKIIHLGDKQINILNGIDLQVAEGEFVAIMGPSGSGKSTLLRIIAGLDTDYSGEVIVDGKGLSQLKEDQLADFRNQEIGIVFQNYNLIQSLNVLDNVSLPLFFSKSHFSKKTAAKRIKEVGLATLTKGSTKSLSGGEQQRVAIARALVNQPSILLADEPTGALDSQNSTATMNLFRSINIKQGTTILMVTHDEHMAQYSDRIIRITDGKIAGDGA